MNQPLRGMKDLFSETLEKYQFISQKCLEISKRFGYKEVATPIMESSDVFNKTLGDESNILQKETYQFTDKGENSVTLRPEGTASIVRFLISEKLSQSQQEPLRIFYQGPMFRYERPQKGRLRQFHQLGVELFGLEEATAELETIELADMLLKEIGISSKVQLHINTLGDQESQQAYRNKLIEYLIPYTKDLSRDSQIRLSKNPLRILDSKDPKDKDILKSAPLPFDSLNSVSRSFYNTTLSLLNKRGLKFTQDKYLVRGLDYYTHTVFEYKSSDLGSQDTLLAGGRYNNLVQKMGGSKLAGIGWAGGLERLGLLVDQWAQEQTPIAIAYSDIKLQAEAIELAYQLRSKGLSIYLPEASGLAKQMKKANKKSCSYVIVLGSDEWERDSVVLKNMQTSEQKEVATSQLAETLLS